MANQEHLEILRQGVEAWNQWRKEHPDVMPALDSANLSNFNLCGANLRGACLNDSDLSRTVLFDADLRGAFLFSTRLDRTYLGGACLERVHCGWTAFNSVDLSQVHGLETVQHVGPSAVSIDTFSISLGRIPGPFLRGCGVPDDLIEHLSSFHVSPIQFFSCFISYSTDDEVFASRLHNDFQANGIRCWKWNLDARTGRVLWREIDQTIKGYDKLVLIASESSLKSPAVNREIERALVQEDDRQKKKFEGDANVDPDVLFPVRIDDFIFSGWEHERKVDVTKKTIADARKWETDPAIYTGVLGKLVRDLRRVKNP